jgi:type I restriction enzyme S subunit
MDSQPPIDLSPVQWAIVQDILTRLAPGREVWAFGSRARRAAKPYSDLDLAILADKPLALSELAALAEAFQDSALPFKVDVVDWATTAEGFRRIIEAERVVLVGGKV